MRMKKVGLYTDDFYTVGIRRTYHSEKTGYIIHAKETDQDPESHIVAKDLDALKDLRDIIVAVIDAERFGDVSEDHKKFNRFAEIELV
jgi:hypothetical protein